MVDGHLRLLTLQFSQALLQTLNVCIPLFALVAAGAALQELNLQGQLAKLKVLAFFPQIHTAAHRAVLRAQSCRVRHPQGVPTRNKRQGDCCTSNQILWLVKY